MRALLDTCVLSELRRTRPDPRVQAFIQELESDDLYLSVVSVGEITKGISLRPDDEVKRELRSWLQKLERLYAERILPIDAETARIWGELTVSSQKRGRVVSAADGLIAATAHRYGLHVATRNTPDFETTGVLVINPWNGS